MDFVGRVQVLTLEGVPLQVLPINTCGGPRSLCASAQYVHVLCMVDMEAGPLLNSYADDLNADDEYVDLGLPMHSLVGFKIRA